MRRGRGGGRSFIAGRRQMPASSLTCTSRRIDASRAAKQGLTPFLLHTHPTYTTQPGGQKMKFYHALGVALLAAPSALGFVQPAGK